MSLMEERLKRHVKKGDVIFRDGESGQSMFIVVQGQVEISKVLGDQKTVLSVLEPGSIFGEMAIIDNHPRSATATAVNNAILIELSREMFRTKMEGVPKWLQAFFAIIVERLRMATRNQSILLTRGAGRQIVNLLAMLAQQQEPDSTGKVLLPWKETITSIAFFIGLNEERVNDMVNKLVSLHLAESDRREGIGRVFALDDPDKFHKFARYSRERHLIETGHTKEMSEEFRFKDNLEMELLQVLEEIITEEGAAEDFPTSKLEEQLEERYKKTYKLYQPLVEGYLREGIIDSFHPEGSQPAYRISNRELIDEKLAKCKLLIEFKTLDQKIME